MLVLSRQRDETIMIGDAIGIMVVDIRGDKVRLGINAPPRVPVHRKEVYEDLVDELRKRGRLGEKEQPTNELLIEQWKLNHPDCKGGKEVNGMLVLSRERDETIMIGDDIEITVVDIRGEKVRLGTNAPPHIPVHRKEIYEAIKREN